jgi:hypothetical protein
MWLTKEQVKEAKKKLQKPTMYSTKKAPVKKGMMYKDYLKKAKAKGDIDQADYNESLHLSSRYREKDVI